MVKLDLYTWQDLWTTTTIRPQSVDEEKENGRKRREKRFKIRKLAKILR
jgi:hypothetical protein